MRFLLFGFLFSASVSAQTFTRIIAPFIVETNERVLSEPMGGGTYVPKTELVDIDQDGDLDLLITQIDGRLTFYESSGWGYRWVTDFFDSLNVNQWARFVDIDNDGDADLFTNNGGSSIAFYENLGALAEPQFVLRQSELKDSAGTGILSENQSVPEFADIDGDGDLDLFTGRSIGTLALYRNIGNSTNPKFRFETDQFEGILIISGAKAGHDSRHGASSIRFFDLDGDNDLDLFWGDFFSTSMYYLENTGSVTAPQFKSITSSVFPPNLLSLGFNAPLFGDLNGDMRPDLLVSVLFREQDLDNLWYFAGNPDGSFQLVTRNFFSHLDVGRQAAPVFADLNGDGLKDLLIGSYHNGIEYFVNQGGNDSWNLKQSSLSMQSALQDSFVLKPAVADMDGDGDLDMVVGGFNGKLAYLANVGSPTNPIFSVVTNAIGNIDVGNYSAPALVDLDADGDLDLVVGDDQGRLSFFNNIGTAASMAFAPTPTMMIAVPGELEVVPAFNDYDHDHDEDLFVGTKSGKVILFENAGDSTNAVYTLVSERFADLKTTQSAVPQFVDYDADGDADLILGNAKGGLEFYLAGPQAPVLEAVPMQFATVGRAFVFRLRSTGNPPPEYALLDFPEGMDIKANTGRIQWTPEAAFVGLHTVSARASNNIGADTVKFEIRVNPAEKPVVQLFATRPNPASEKTTIHFSLDGQKRARTIIFNILGQRVRLLDDQIRPPGDHLIEWDLRDDRGNAVSNGVYIAGVLTPGKTVFRKLTVIRK